MSITQASSTSVKILNELAAAIQDVANEAKVLFFDASSVATAGDDGIHFSEEAHIALADALEKKIHEIFSSSRK